MPTTGSAALTIHCLQSAGWDRSVCKPMCSQLLKSLLLIRYSTYARTGKDSVVTQIQIPAEYFIDRSSFTAHRAPLGNQESIRQHGCAVNICWDCCNEGVTLPRQLRVVAV